MASLVKSRFKKAKRKVKKFLEEHGMSLRKSVIVVNPDLSQECMIKVGYPNQILVNRKNIAESTLAYQLINVAQKRLITPVNIKYLYSLVTEGLSDYVVSKLYSNYIIINSSGNTLVSLLESDDEEDILAELFKLNSIRIADDTVDKLMQSEKVNDYFKQLIRPRLDMVKRALQVTDELDLERSIHLPFGEELKTWTYITKPKFNPKWDKIEKVIEKYYKDE